MPRDNRCVHIAHVCFYVCCSDYVGSVTGKYCCIAAVIEDSWGFSLVVLEYVCVLDVMDAVFYVRIVRRGAVVVYPLP